MKDYYTLFIFLARQNAEYLSDGFKLFLRSLIYPNFTISNLNSLKKNLISSLEKYLTKWLS